MPGSVIPSQASGVDKLLHFSIYLLFGILLSRELAEITSRWRAAILAIGIAVAFAAADEWHQRFIPGRSTEFADWQADTLGASIGALSVAAFAAFAALRRRGQAPPVTG